MKLEGATAHFVESVVARTPGQQFETEQLDVTFTEPIRLAGLQSQAKPKPRKIVCPGEVWMKSWETENGQQTSLQRVQIANLEMDMESGAVLAAGPAHTTTVRRQTESGKPGTGGGGRGAGGGNLGLSNPQSLIPHPSSLIPHPSSLPLICLDVRCQGPLTGNLYQRTMAFQEQVRAIYVPTGAWETVPETDDPTQLGPGAMVLRCEQLRATQMLVPVAGVRSWDMQATGNARVEGTTETGDSFFARAARMSYDEGKGLMVLEGEPRADAIVSTQKHAGGSPKEYKGQQIQYWPKTGAVDSSFRSFDLNGLRPLAPGNPLGGGKR
jgi:hypothetical protein